MPKPSRKISETALDVQSCSVAYGERVVLKDVSFRVPKGNIVAIVGPNGSGKTTLLRAMAGLLPFQGTIHLLGKPPSAMRGRIGYVPQRFQFDPRFPITVEEYLRLSLAEAYTPARLTSLFAEVGLEPRQRSHLLGALSGGQLQRVLIAQAIGTHPPLLFLDEPSTGIDLVGEATFRELLVRINKTHGTTIVLVSHDIALVSKLVDAVVCLNQELVCYGHPSDVLSNKKMQELYGEHLKAPLHHLHALER